MENSEIGNDKGKAEVKDYQAILELQLDGIAILGRNNSIKYINPAGLKLLNLPSDITMGSSFPFSLTPDSPLETWIDTEETHWIRLIANEITWDDENAYLVQIRDISESKREEKRLNTAVAAAEARANELDALKFVADQLNQIVLRDDAIKAGLETVLSLFRTEMAWVLLPDENNMVQMYAANRAPTAVINEKRTFSKDFKCIGLTQVIKGELSEPGMLNFSEVMEKVGFRSSMPNVHYAIPLILDDKPLGLLNLVPMDEKELDLQEFNLLKTIGKQFSIAIQRALPVSLSVVPPSYPQVFDLTNKTSGNGLDLTNVTKNVLKLALDLTGAEAGSLGILNPTGTNLMFKANFTETITELTLVHSDDLLWDVVSNGKPVLVKGDIQGERLPMFFASGAKSLILVPVSVGSKILGVMALYSFDITHELNEFTEAIAVSLGKQAGNAVQNALLFMEVQKLTTTDPLTGLQNQKGFITQAVREMERTWRYKRPLSLVSIVIDDILSINDRFGRDIGDRVMQVLGQICNENLRKVDIIGRYAGNNFIILLPETDKTGAFDVAERLRMKTESWCMDTSEGSVSFTISLGIAGLIDNEVIDLERFIDRANQALYTALQSGGNQALIWQPSIKKY